MASVTVFQDQENVVQDHENMHLGLPRVAPKPYNSDIVQQATPRRALGDVRNIQIPKLNTSVKAAMHSDKKVSSSVMLNSKSSFRKPFGTAKKTGKHAIQILEDEASEKSDIKGRAKTKQSEKCLLPDGTQKENCFPFIDTDFQFSMPNYLKDLSANCLSNHVWLPPYTWCNKQQDIAKSDPDPSKLEIENLPPCSNIEESLFDDVMTNFLEVSTGLPSYPDKFCELGDIECDLTNIDISCSLSVDFTEIVKKPNYKNELCINTESSIHDNSLNSTSCRSEIDGI